MGTAALRAARHVRHLRTGDQENDDLLDGMTVGLTAGLQRPVEIAHGLQDGTPGERVLTDPAVCPFWALPHAAQWVGGKMPARPPGLTDPEWETYARESILDYAGAYRCSPRALRKLAARYLTGDKSIQLVYRYLDDYTTLLIVRPAELDDEPALLAAVNHDDVVMAGGRVVLLVTNSVPWAQLHAAGTTWADLTAADASWQDLTTGVFVP